MINMFEYLESKFEENKIKENIDYKYWRHLRKKRKQNTRRTVGFKIKNCVKYCFGIFVYHTIYVK